MDFFWSKFFLLPLLAFLGMGVTQFGWAQGSCSGVYDQNPLDQRSGPNNSVWAHLVTKQASLPLISAEGGLPKKGGWKGFLRDLEREEKALGSLIRKGLIKRFDEENGVPVYALTGEIWERLSPRSKKRLDPNHPLFSYLSLIESYFAQLHRSGEIRRIVIDPYLQVGIDGHVPMRFQDGQLRIGIQAFLLPPFAFEALLIGHRLIAQESIASQAKDPAQFSFSDIMYSRTPENRGFTSSAQIKALLSIAYHVVQQGEKGMNWLKAPTQQKLLAKINNAFDDLNDLLTALETLVNSPQGVSVKSSVAFDSEQGLYHFGYRFDDLSGLRRPSPLYVVVRTSEERETFLRPFPAGALASAIRELRKLQTTMVPPLTPLF